MSTKLQDEYLHGRIPLKPLPYINRDLAFSGELMVDSVTNDDNEPTYHLYLVDPVEKTVYIDLSAKIANEVAKLSGLTIPIEGLKDPVLLTDILSYIYNRFIAIKNPEGFNPNSELRDIIDDKTLKTVMISRTGDTVLPVTRADAVFDTAGRTIQDRLDNMTRVAFTNDYIMVTHDNQNVFSITYPFLNYRDNGNYMELRIGTTIIDKSRYYITDLKNNDGYVYGCNITFYNDTFEEGRRIDILYIYNTTDVNGESFKPIDGNSITNWSIDTEKLSKVSSSFSKNDPSSIATSKAVFDLYQVVNDIISGAGARALFSKDSSNSSKYIIANLANDGILLGSHYILLSVLTNDPKNADFTLRVLYRDANMDLHSREYDISAPKGIGKDRLVKFLVRDADASIISISDLHFNIRRYVYSAADGENVISFANLTYDDNSTIRVFRNGLRLFVDLDYSIDMSSQTIRLFNRTVRNEKIVFECENIEY